MESWCRRGDDSRLDTARCVSDSVSRRGGLLHAELARVAAYHNLATRESGIVTGYYLSV